MITQTNQTNLGDTRFVDGANGDYRLRHDSPLIDIGEPVDPTTTFDLGGGARLVDGDQAGGARREIGAFEYQAQAPTALLVRSRPRRHADLRMDRRRRARRHRRDAERHDRDAGRPHDRTDRDRSRRPHRVHHDDRHHHGPCRPRWGHRAPPAADTVAPLISNLSARPARVRRGRRITFRFTLREAAAVRIEVQRVLPGRRQGGRCRKPSRQNRRGRPCKRFSRVAVLQRAGTAGANAVPFRTRVRGRLLPAGAYRAVVRATDAAGNRSVARRVGFTIRRQDKAARSCGLTPTGDQCVPRCLEIAGRRCLPCREGVIDLAVETLTREAHPAGVVRKNRTFRRWIVAWIGAPVLAIVNGAVRELGYKDQVGDATAHQISVAPLIALLALYFWALERRWPLETKRAALSVGATWVVLSVIFEFGFGHYVEGDSWADLLENYDVTAGNLWILILLWIAAGPATMRAIADRRSA